MQYINNKENVQRPCQKGAPVSPTPETIDELLQAAQASFSLGDTTSAAEYFDLVLSQTVDHPEALFGLAVIHQSLEDYSHAIALYQRLLSSFPDHPPTLQNLGCALESSKKIKEAKKIYTTLAAIDPQNITAQFNLGMLHYQDDNLSAAIDCFQNTLAVDPHHFQAGYNLGVVYLSLDNLEEAETYLQNAIDHVPDDTDCLFNLGLVYKKMGRLEKSAAYYRDALRTAPNDFEIHYQLGIVQKDLYELEASLSSFHNALDIDPLHGAAHSLSGVVYQQLGDIPNALSAFEKALELNHNPESARHMIHALSGITPEEAPRQYIADLFDHFSGHFDNCLLNELDYALPQLLFDTLQSILPEGKTFSNMIDLGCGTGLAGEKFHPITTKIHGVDLSPKMVEKARAKNIYETLETDDIVDFLHGGRQSYDLFIATDVFVYLGDLRPLFQAVQKNGIPDAYFLFSTEISDKNGYILTPSGRYAYSSNYIKEIAAEFGFDMAFSSKANIRKERGNWITGAIFCLKLKK